MNKSDLINIIDVDQGEFELKIIEASEKKLIIVDFWAPWCKPCKQLTPVIENIIKKTKGKVLLAKVNIDSNQELANQLNIQSIPSVFAFKDKKVVDAFQGVIPENKIIEFIEKNLGEKLTKDFSDFYKKIENLIIDKNYNEAQEFVEKHLIENSDDVRAINLFLQCLAGLKLYDEAETFLNSLDKIILENENIKSFIQKLNIIKKNLTGPSLENLKEKFKNDPKNSKILIKLCEKLFAENLIDEAFEILFKNFKINTDIKKKKILELFEVLGVNNEKTILYRKKLSSIIFS